MMTALYPPLTGAFRLCKMGIRNAAVLPDPETHANKEGLVKNQIYIL